MPFTFCKIHCAICAAEIDYHGRYGRDVPTCGIRCYDEFEWRRTLSILGKPYHPDPRRLAESEAAPPAPN